MSKGIKIVIAIVVVGVLAAGAVWWMRNSDRNKATETPDKTATATITYTEEGFSPAEVTVTSGEAIKFVNDSDSEIDPASDPHPVHTKNRELNVGDLAPGEAKTITVTTKGTWGYHNHYKASAKGVITVN